MSAELRGVIIKVTVITLLITLFLSSIPIDFLSGQRGVGHSKGHGSGDLLDRTDSRGGPKLPDSMIEYLIITPDEFADAYEPLMEWKTRKGVPTKIVTIEEIDDQYDLQPDVGAEIQQFLADFNVNNNYTLIWVLLGADHEWIPGRFMYTEASQTLIYGDDFYPSDFYYAGLSSDWDTNDDGVFGEVNDSKSQLYEVDYNPKAFVGRLPADNVGQVQNYVSSVLQYEQTPLMDGWLKKALLTDAVFDPPNIFDNYATPSVDEGYGYWEDNGMEATKRIEPYLKDDFEITRLYDYDQIYGGNYSSSSDILDQDTFVETINDGYGLVNVVSHSFLSGNGTVSYDGEGMVETWRRFFYYTDAASMSNGIKKSFMYFSDCDILNYTEKDDSNFETLLTNPTGGAIAVVGPTGSTYRGESDMFLSRGNWWMADRFWYLFDQGYIRPGEALYRMKYEYYLYMIDDLNIPYDWASLNTNMVSYNLLGDPEIPIWPGQPEILEVQVPKVYVDTDTIWVTVKDNTTKSGLQGSMICISGDDGTYIRGTTDVNGTVKIPSSFTQPATFNLTVTHDGYLPYIGKLRIRPEPTDLAVASDDDISFDFSTDPPVATDSGSVKVFISNLGNTKPEESFIVNLTDTYNYFGVNYIDYLGEHQVSNLPASSKVELTIPWTPVRPGEHTINIKVDANNDVEESDETNNVISKSKRVSGPDLRLTSSDIDIVPGSKVSMGDQITINATISNIDWGQVNGFEVSFYDGNPDAGGELLSTETYPGTLNINEKITVSYKTMPVSTGGMHEYYVELDADNKVIESNELNNRAFTTFYINHLPSFIDIGAITVLEDEDVSNYIDLLDENIINDEDNTTADMKLGVVNVSNPACGFTLRDGRYVDIASEPDWFGKATVNLSLTDGIAVIHREIIVDIIPVNDAPVIERISSGKPELKVGEEVVVYIDIKDVDSDLLNVQLTSTLFPGQTFKLDVMFGTPLETGIMIWDGSGNLTFKNRPIDVETFEHSITVAVFDELSLTQKTYDLTITEEEVKDDGDEGLFGLGSDTASIILIVIILLVIVVVLLLLFSVLRRRAYGAGAVMKEDDLAEEGGEEGEEEGEGDEEGETDEAEPGSEEDVSGEDDSVEEEGGEEDTEEGIKDKEETINGIEEGTDEEIDEEVEEGTEEEAIGDAEEDFDEDEDSRSPDEGPVKDDGTGSTVPGKVLEKESPGDDEQVE